MPFLVVASVLTQPWPPQLLLEDALAVAAGPVKDLAGLRQQREEGVKHAIASHAKELEGTAASLPPPPPPPAVQERGR